MTSFPEVGSLFPKRLSACDFQPFSGRRKVTADRPVEREKSKSPEELVIDTSWDAGYKKLEADLFTKDLDLRKFTTENPILLSDEDDSSSESSSSSDDDTATEDVSNTRITNSPSQPSSLPLTPTPAPPIKPFTNSNPTAVQSSKWRESLFSLPSDIKTSESDYESPEEDNYNVVEASFGKISSHKDDSENFTQIFGKLPIAMSPTKLTKLDDETSKSKLLNCPVCGKIVLEKSMRLTDHFNACHTPQRREEFSLGQIPTHAHSDGSAFIRQGDQHLSGNQCFICCRICNDRRQLRSHLQLHKVYVHKDEAKNASDVDELNSSSDSIDTPTSDDDGDKIHSTTHEFEIDSDENQSKSISDESINENNTSQSSFPSITEEAKEYELEFRKNALSAIWKLTCSDPKILKLATCLDEEKKQLSPNRHPTPRFLSPTRSGLDLDADVDPACRCPDCDVIFPTAVECSQHRIRDHDCVLMYRCVREECRKVFSHFQTYRQHHRHHRQRAFICNLCNHHFSVYGLLISHKRQKHRFLAKQHAKIHCQGCQLLFPSHECFTWHASDKNESERMNLATLRPDELVRYAVEEAESGMITCPICKNTYHKERFFHEHIETHFPTKAIQCTVTSCKKEFESWKSLRIHFMSHYISTSDTSPCPRCSRDFVNNSALSRHRKNCHDKCYICQRSFYLPGELRQHVLRVHHWLTFVCYRCKKTFKNFDVLFSHHREIHPLLVARKHRTLFPDRVNIQIINEETLKHYPHLGDVKNVLNRTHCFITFSGQLYVKIRPCQEPTDPNVIETNSEEEKTTIKKIGRSYRQEAEAKDEPKTVKRKKKTDSVKMQDNITDIVRSAAKKKRKIAVKGKNSPMKANIPIIKKKTKTKVKVENITRRK